MNQPFLQPFIWLLLLLFFPFFTRKVTNDLNDYVIYSNIYKFTCMLVISCYLYIWIMFIKLEEIILNENHLM